MEELIQKSSPIKEIEGKKEENITIFGRSSATIMKKMSLYEWSVFVR